MTREKLSKKYFASLPGECRYNGEELYKNRKADFILEPESHDFLQVVLPFSMRSTRMIKPVFFASGESLTGRCTCKDFKLFSECTHLAAGALFISNGEISKPKPQRTGKIQIGSETGTGYELGFLFHHGLGEIGIKFMPVLLVAKTTGLTMERVTGLPGIKATLISQFKSQDQEAILQLEGGFKFFGQQATTSFGYNSAFSDGGQTEAYEKYFWTRLKALWPTILRMGNVLSLQAPRPFRLESIREIAVSPSVPRPELYIYPDKEHAIIQLRYLIDGQYHNHQNVSVNSPLLLEIENQYLLHDEWENVLLAKEYKRGFKAVPLKSKASLYQEVVVPLRKKYEVELHPDLQMEIKEADVQPFVLVAEYLGNYLMMIPHFSYEDHIVAYNDKKEIAVTGKDQNYLISRNLQLEKEFFESLRPLHPGFTRQLQQDFFYVPFQDVMKGSWFLKTIRRLQEEDVQVRGMENLKKFKHSTKTPRFKLRVSSGIDWFDLKIKFSYDDTAVPLKDIQTTILSGQRMVVLGDGSFGILPEEWLTNFEALIRMGKVEGDNLRIDKKLFYLLQDAEIQIKEENILKELEEKKKALLRFEEQISAPVSKHIRATLRPYQMAGYQWMQSLDHLGWGGCLADDMGLGKTLQTITFLQYVKEKYPGSCNLIVCPTSLIYNWEEELKKFAPRINYHIHYGINRQFDDEHLQKFDLIITSYGSVRNDIDELKKYKFHYIVLDESQAIKNPEARLTKACFLLEAKNRIILSGTPVQNNTFDLFAQMHFLNPGLLGNKHSFKNNFSIPIDKEQNKDAAQRLRKITRPFILRRTKENVAHDLPDKSEIVLWCHMKEKQRQVYERYKQFFRNSLISKIEEDGVKKSAFKILEGLTRLRQICDSPELIGDTFNATTESAKIYELLRELEENTGNHKILVFSQFTSMLGLIRRELEKAGISHLYLDGSTPGKTRMELVTQFQQDASIKTFLISLKAGGVGLNLTAADYVYLVDPWWNPAAESQAIDRTHRIGQTKKVFAYKMICKDSIEEKILQLQQKKKSLSEDLIGEEASFVSKLTREDIEFLFE